MKRFQFDPYARANQLVVDGSIFCLSFAGAYAIRFEGLPSPPYIEQFLVWLPILVALRLLVHWRLGIYRFIWRYVSLSDTVAIGRSLGLVTILLLTLRLFYPDSAPFAVRVRIPLSVIALEFLLSLTGSLGARGLRRILSQRRPSLAGNARKASRVLLVGAGSAGVMVTRELASNPEVKVVGFLDDDPGKIGSVVNGVPVLGPTSFLPSVVEKDGVDQVILCITRPSRAAVKKLWALCEGLSVQTQIVPGLEEILQGQFNLRAFRDVQMADLLGRETLETPLGTADVAPTYRGKRILITGAGGSIGSELAHQLMGLLPEQLVLLDKDESGLHELCLRLGADSAKLVLYPVVADIRFPERLKAIFARFRPEVVFHAAAHKHVPLMELNPSEAILNNVFGTRSLVEQALDFGVSRFVLISTDKAVKPVSIMGASKRVCEMIVQAKSRGSSATRFACVRFGNVVGSRGSVIPLFQKQIARGGPVTVTHPDVQRYFMTIPEAVRLVIQAGTLGSSGEIFLLDMGDPVPIIGLARDLIELSGLRPGEDIQIEVTQLRPGDKIREELIDPRTESVSPTPFEKIWVVHSGEIFSASFEDKLAFLEEAARRESLKEIHQVLQELSIGFEPGGNSKAALD